MRKALLPLFASLALCGAATVALLATNAHAQPEARKPMLIAQATPAAPPLESARPAREFRRRMPAPGEIAAHVRRMCDDGYAREVGALAYLDAKLELTPAQKSTFERWKTVKLDIAKRRAASCAEIERPRSAERPTVIDRMARREDMLKRRLADLGAERPALEAFYKSLNPDQQQEFTRAAEHRMMERGSRMFARRGPGMDHGMMDHMMHRGPMTMPPPDGPAHAPMPPPPQ